MDLTLRDGVNLQEAISSAKQIDEQSKAAGFYQEALDHVARQGYGNASFEVGGEEGLDIVEEFYTDKNQETDAHQTKAETANTTARTKAKPKPNQGRGFVRDMQKGLQGSVRAVN